MHAMHAWPCEVSSITLNERVAVKLGQHRYAIHADVGGPLQLNLATSDSIYFAF